jgi:DNA-binding XRE family transcriptional regulator
MRTLNVCFLKEYPKMKKSTLDNIIAQELNDPEFKQAYDRELLINKIAKMTVELRHSTNLTQTELAKKIGSSQAAIARLESGTDSRIPSLDLLARIACASHAKLNLEFKIIEPTKLKRS